MKALTIWQPWASLIILGYKPYEFRGRPAPLSVQGERIAIHAAKRPIKAGELRDIIHYAQSPTGREDGIALGAIDYLERAWRGEIAVPLAAIIGTAIIGQPRTLQHRGGAQPRYAWPMGDIDRWPHAIPAQGAQGFWTWQEARR